MIIKIQCHPKVGTAIANTIDAIRATIVEAAGEQRADEMIGQIQFDLNDPKPRTEGKGRELGARIQYRAILPTGTKEEIMAAVEKNVKLLGNSESQQHVVVYRDIVNVTMEGGLVTEKEIREQRSMKAGSSQRVIGDLARMQLLEKIPVVRG